MNAKTRVLFGMYGTDDQVERAYEVGATELQVSLWLNSGFLIQDAMANLSDNDREYILTGMTGLEWDEMFGEEI